MYWSDRLMRFMLLDYYMQYLALSIVMFSVLPASSCQSLEAKPEKIALISAVKKKSPEKVRACLCKGEDPNSRDTYGRPVLHWACYLDEKGGIVKLLLGAGAKIDAKDMDGWIALDWAQEKSHVSATKQLIRKAIDLNHLNILGHDGKTLLHYAAALDDEASSKIVKELLALGLDSKVKDNRGSTPLDDAKRKDVVVQLLLSGTH